MCGKPSFFNFNYSNMKITIEISLYPLQENYVPAVLGFIERLNRHQDVKIKTNNMSTQIVGDYEKLMPLIARELKPSLEIDKGTVAVLKILNKAVEI